MRVFVENKGVVLREYQEKAIEEARQAVSLGKRKILLVLPTGVDVLPIF